MDHTMNQEAGFEAVLKLCQQTNLGGVYSLDLSAATDRLPVWFQAKILSLLMENEKFGQQWKELMTNRSFYLPNEEIYIRYKVGQPMGIKSSFAMLALTHHVIVQLAHLQREQRERSFAGYAILGDDIVLSTHEVADNYRYLMARLGLSISELKSLVSFESPYSAEFCKRLIVNGEEWSPVPSGILQKMGRTGKYAPQMQNILHTRNLIGTN